MKIQKRGQVTSRISLVGLFAVLSFIFTLPILVIVTQQQQQIGSKAYFSTPTTSKTQAVGYIAGYIFHDDNQNGLRDPEEKPFTGVEIKITTINKGISDVHARVAQIVSDISTDSNGYFFYRISDPTPQASEYVIRILPPNGYKTINTNPIIMSDLTPQSTRLLQVGLFQIGSIIAPTPIVSNSPLISCFPRPACLDSTPRCMIPERQDWCPPSTRNPLR